MNGIEGIKTYQQNITTLVLLMMKHETKKLKKTIHLKQMSTHNDMYNSNAHSEGKLVLYFHHASEVNYFLKMHPTGKNRVPFNLQFTNLHRLVFRIV